MNDDCSRKSRNRKSVLGLSSWKNPLPPPTIQHADARLTTEYCWARSGQGRVAEEDPQYAEPGDALRAEPAHELKMHVGAHCATA